MTRSISTAETAAAKIVALARQTQVPRQCFLYVPAKGVVKEIKASTFPPFLTVTGDEVELESLLRCFEGWSGELKIGVLNDQGLLDFWVY